MPRLYQSQHGPRLEPDQSGTGDLLPLPESSGGTDALSVCLPKSERARLEAMAEPDHLAGLDENDPQSMARFMKKMGDEMGEDLEGDLSEAMETEEAGPLELKGTDSL